MENKDEDSFNSMQIDHIAEKNWFLCDDLNTFMGDPISSSFIMNQVKEDLRVDEIYSINTVRCLAQRKHTFVIARQENMFILSLLLGNVNDEKLKYRSRILGPVDSLLNGMKSMKLIDGPLLLVEKGLDHIDIYSLSNANALKTPVRVQFNVPSSNTLSTTSIVRVSAFPQSNDDKTNNDIRVIVKIQVSFFSGESTMR